MKLPVLLFFIVAISCNQKNPSAPQQTEIPKALEKGSGDYSFEVKKIRYDDLVQELYNEILQSDNALLELDNKIRNLPSEKADSLKLFTGFNDKNMQYYRAAKDYTSRIADSTLKKRIELLLDASMAAFEKRIAVHKNMLAQSDSLTKQLSDYHTAIKLMTTLDVIEKYQKAHTPSTQPIQAINKKAKAIISQSDSLLKK